MELLWAIVLLVAGIALLVKGSEWLIDGAVALASGLGLSRLVIGLTIVAMGTSAPEVAASVGFSLSKMGDAALGNVYGSNVANLALIGGLCAWVRPLSLSRMVLLRDIPILLAVSLGFYAVCADRFVGRGESFAMLAIFLAILAAMVFSERKMGAKDEVAPAEAKPKMTGAKGAAFFAAGLVGLTLGAKATVMGASTLGASAGLSEAFIGSTIVAVGTSLPELMTSLVAVLKGHDDLSVGNLVGSNIFNLFMVTGLAGLARPFVFGAEMAGASFWLMVGITILFAALAYAFKKINRWSGLILLLSYAGYIGYLLSCGEGAH